MEKIPVPIWHWLGSWKRFWWRRKIIGELILTEGVVHALLLLLLARDCPSAEQSRRWRWSWRLGSAATPRHAGEASLMVGDAGVHREGGVGQSWGTSGLGEVVIDKPVLGIVTNRKDVFILYLADGTLDDVSEQFNTKPEINLNETLRPSKSWSHRLKLISVSPWTAKNNVLQWKF